MAGLSDGRRRFLFRRRLSRLLDKNSRTSWSSDQGVALKSVPDLSTRASLASVFLIVTSLFFATTSSFAQKIDIESGLQSGEMLISDVSFNGDLHFDKTQLALHVRSARNRRLLGIPGFTWWLWLYNFGAYTLGGSGIGKAFMATGEPPAIYDSTTVASDLEQLLIFYHDEGFREATVAVSVRKISSSDRVAIRFDITAGRPTYIRRFSYHGLEALDHDQKVRIASGSLLKLEDPENRDNPLTQDLSNRRYSAPLLTEEGRRLLTALLNEGYAAVARDSIHAVVYPISRDSFDVTIDVKLGPRFRFGDIHFDVTGPEFSAPDRSVTDSLSSTSSGVRGGQVDAVFHSERKLQFGLLKRKLDFRPGDWYDQSKLITTKRRLDGTGTFAFTEIETIIPNSEDSLSSDDIVHVKGPLSEAPRISHRFNLQSRRRHQLRLQTFVVQRNGAIAESNNEWGFGVGVTYSNLNLFGGGENFTVNATTSLASEIGVPTGFTSAQWEIGSNLAFPYLTWPMGVLDSWFDLDDARSHISLSFLAARRDALKLILRGRGLARYRFELKHSQALTSLFDLMEITVSDPDTMDGFQHVFLDDILDSIDDPVQQARIIQDYTEPQFNDARRLTLRLAKLDPLRRDDGYAYEAAIEGGGNLGYLLDRFVFTAGTVEGTLPGLPVFGTTGSTNRLLYGQYIRFVTDLRRFNRINSLSVFAWKIIVGAAHPYGQATVIPLGRRFFSGGATSVRAWKLSELGPGASNLQSDAGRNNNLNTNIFGGEIKLEGSVELRHTVLRKFMAADWVFALFVDAGNVWFGPRNPGVSAGRFHIDRFMGEIGVGAGFGVRLVWDYLIVRLDFASKVHDPVRQGELWPDGVSRPVVHFGFGHSF